MSSRVYNIQEKTPFSKSQLWQINRDFYHQNGIGAWSDEIVPHHITNSSLAATAYAELIYAFLSDLESNGKTDKIVYILELGAGLGRLCFNILEHLDQLISANGGCSTQYCYVLSDIVEENLSFYSNHPRLQDFYNRGILDISYFDAVESQELILRKSNKTIANSDLDQPILAIANYFFDSLPNELFYLKNREIFDCSVSIDSLIDPEENSAQDLIRNMELTFHKSTPIKPEFENKILNKILSQYSQMLSDTYILFPKIAMGCLANISNLSKMGLVLLTMDKGFKEIQELAGREKPDFVKHGSFSLWVNFHAISQFCLMSGGSSMFDSSTNLSIELGCLNFIKQPIKFDRFEQTYRKHTTQLNLDDFDSVKELVFKNLANVNLTELLGLIRLNSYDSSIFINLLPIIKQLSKNITIKERSRLRQTITHVWTKYYAIKEDYDFSYELGGLLYDLGFYNDALSYFNASSEEFGNKFDVDYNLILCYYQLRQDKLFYEALSAAKLRFPESNAFLALDKLDMK